MSGMFIGMSIGAWLGGSLYGTHGMAGLAALVTVSCFLVFVLKVVQVKKV
jgi:predicted MFS family arabinose efflux permease